MKEELITVETAELAKEKGFDIKTARAYDGADIICSHSESIFKPLNYNSSDGVNYLSAPTQSLLQKWLREDKGINVEVIRVDSNSDLIYESSVEIWMDNIQYETHGTYTGKTYELSLEKGLITALKLIKV